MLIHRHGVGEPAVHDNGFVASMDLDFGHFKNDISHSLDPRAATSTFVYGDPAFPVYAPTFKVQVQSSLLVP